MAGAAVTQSWVPRVTPGSSIGLLTFNVLADAADGSVPATETDQAIYGQILGVTTIPGTTQPTDDWDLTLKDSDGVDVLGGQGADRDTANPEQAVPIHGSLYAPRAVASKLTLGIANNIVHSALITVKVYVLRV